MKKIMCAILASILALSLAGCSGGVSQKGDKLQAEADKSKSQISSIDSKSDSEENSNGDGDSLESEQSELKKWEKKDVTFYYDDGTQKQLKHLTGQNLKTLRENGEENLTLGCKLNIGDDIVLLNQYDLSNFYYSVIDLKEFSNGSGKEKEPENTEFHQLYPNLTDALYHIDELTSKDLGLYILARFYDLGETMEAIELAEFSTSSSRPKDVKHEYDEYMLCFIVDESKIQNISVTFFEGSDKKTSNIDSNDTNFKLADSSCSLAIKQWLGRNFEVGNMVETYQDSKLSLLVNVSGNNVTSDMFNNLVDSIASSIKNSEFQNSEYSNLSFLITPQNVMISITNKGNGELESTVLTFSDDEELNAKFELAYQKSAYFSDIDMLKGFERELDDLGKKYGL